MKAEHRFFWGIALLASTTALAFSACATGTDGEDLAAGSSTGSGTGGGSVLPPGKIGGPCEEQADCVEGTCTTVGGGKICTTACPPSCPIGTYCAIIEGDPICVPDLDQQCIQCTGSVDCKSPSDECLKSPAGDKFCAIDCTTMGSCPNGFTCVVGADYLSGMGGSGPGADAGADSGSDAGDAGQDAGKPPPSGVPYKFCVPNSGGSCPCNAKRDGVKHACSIKNDQGECKGMEHCDGMQGKWLDCDAQTPKPETCNAKDDNCSGDADEGDPNALCADVGPPPPHAGWGCSGGMCNVGQCEAGFAAYPPGPITDGCACPTDSGEPNNVCATATNAGSVSDLGSPITFTGTLSADDDVDVWMFNTVDTAEADTNSYHISVDITAPMPNDEFLMDVMRGACDDAAMGPATSITSYDWCVDGSFAGPNGPEGEASCSATGAIHCNDNSSPYFVRVFRKPGAVGTCTAYTLTISAKGGDPCDFSVKCP